MWKQNAWEKLHLELHYGNVDQLRDLWTGAKRGIRTAMRAATAASLTTTTTNNLEQTFEFVCLFE